MEPTLEFFREALKIDKHRLDEALIQQPELYMQVSTQYLMLVSRSDQAKESLQRIDGDLSIQIRRIKDDAKEKYTESVILAEISNNPDHIAAHDYLMGLRHEANEWLALRDAFVQRSYVLKDLAGLFVAGYFGQNSVQNSAAKADEVTAQRNRAALQAVRTANTVTRPRIDQTA